MIYKIATGIFLLSILGIVVYLGKIAHGNPTGTANYLCNDRKSIFVTYSGIRVSLKLSDGRTFELTEGPVAASYPGMPPYYIDASNSVMFGGSQKTGFTFSELVKATLVETYSNCKGYTA